MKHFLFLVASFFLIASASSAQRLPQIAVPESYQLSLAPERKRFRFKC